MPNVLLVPKVFSTEAKEKKNDLLKQNLLSGVTTEQPTKCYQAFG